MARKYVEEPVKEESKLARELLERLDILLRHEKTIENLSEQHI